jgi:DNA modification methylase
MGWLRRTATPPKAVKPIALMRWLVRLVTWRGAIVVDPFVGSGTTGIACALEERDFYGIDREQEYLDVSERRIAHWQGPMFAGVER